jgi:hypothetical protein
MSASTRGAAGRWSCDDIGADHGCRHNRAQHPRQATPTDTRHGNRHPGQRAAGRDGPTPGDSPHTAALRAMLRDQALMAQVTANVDTWPEPTEQQRQTIAALWHRPTARSP